MYIDINTKESEYKVVIERGCISRTGEMFNTDRKCLIVTDDGVPAGYAETVASECSRPLIMTVPQGEGSKSTEWLERLLLMMLKEGFTRSDCVIAVGGGMAGDLAGFAAAIYMRGIDFYNITTTLLSQADSSIGGKTAINLGGVKNIAGVFRQPGMVLIDTELLDTLPEDQMLSGFAEIIKAGMIADAELFGYIEKTVLGDNDADSGSIINKINIEYVLEAALKVKKAVVEEDEREAGIRRILNYGHTIGHGIESVTGMLHGWCVAVGMIPMCSPEARNRLVPVLSRLGFPLRIDCDHEAVFRSMIHDKKMENGEINAVFAEEPGNAVIKRMTPEELRERLKYITEDRDEIRTDRTETGTQFLTGYTCEDRQIPI